MSRHLANKYAKMCVMVARFNLCNFHVPSTKLYFRICAFVCQQVIQKLVDKFYLFYFYLVNPPLDTMQTRICAAEMAVRYAALSACRKVHVCHCNSLCGATWRSVTITGRTDRRTDRQTGRVRRNMRPPPREEGRIIRTYNEIYWINNN